ncbi:beta-lactamase family protein [Flavobacterium sp. IMCC34852]|uniref:Beta-lactamase family protein n=1 Tax=Flavobacterium rivulicola TaxID=2732161 RepID=A0A7Y3R9S5_9FLAO|nr:serine hydrolase domain-containing protein [Flavobacterium sp. IMCC34852]NNT72130.1 beta-lactamase family protein [Flavobacterium sp. IMCC34852]
MKEKILIISSLLFFLITYGQTNKFQSIMEQYHKEKNFSGVILVATEGKIDYLSSIGMANRETNIPLTPQSKFKIASMTKAFTAVLVMKLYEEGKIELNQTIGFYLSTYKGEAKDKVTIHHLLTYASGIENLAEPIGMKSYQEKLTLDEYIDQYCSGKLISSPGEKSTYSNTEYIILHKIIESVSHKKYEDLLNEIIIKPLKMNNTGVLQSDKIMNSLTNSYTFDTQTKSFVKEEPYYIENYFGAGNMYSTAQDMLLFNNAFFGNKILSDNTTNKMLEINENLGYTAYGFWGSTGWGTFNEKFYYRTGGILGSCSNWINTLEKKKTIIILSNTDATNLYEMSAEIYQID